MPLGPLSQFSKSFRTGVLIAGAVGVVTGVMAWYQAENERRIDTEDVDRRARALAHQLSYTVDAALTRADTDVATALGSRFEGYRRLIGFAVYGPDGQRLASAKAATEFTGALKGPVDRVLAGKVEVTETLRSEGLPVHILATPLIDDKGSTQGVLIVLHDVSYIDERATARLAFEARRLD